LAGINLPNSTPYHLSRIFYDADIRAYPNDENEMIEDKNRTNPDGSVVYVSKGKEHIARPSVSDEPLPTLPLAPTLVPVVGFKEKASANSNASPVNARTEMIRAALGALPIGSTVVFASDDLGALFLVGARIARDTADYREVEHIAQACNCHVTLQEDTGTIAFYRSGG
jgi:hypothetical protein